MNQSRLSHRLHRVLGDPHRVQEDQRGERQRACRILLGTSFSRGSNRRFSTSFADFSSVKNRRWYEMQIRRVLVKSY